MLTLCEFSYVALPFGIATAATIRVGNMLGAGNHKTAKTSGKAHTMPSTSAALCALRLPVQAAAQGRQFEALRCRARAGTISHKLARMGQLQQLVRALSVLIGAAVALQP